MTAPSGERTCSACGADTPPTARFCPSCAAPLVLAPDGLTRAASPAERAPIGAALGPGVGRLASSDTIPVGGFTPGTILADRYRIIGLHGSGGVGEVNRADDLKLGQPVALKFLPRDLAQDPIRRERLLAEVRIARQVSHPNICRVYRHPGRAVARGH